jgi:uncharacterized damage-inducible protein DinB
MQLKEFFLEQLNREAPATRRTLEQVPEGHDDWKPHDKSMALGQLANLVASMPSWVTMTVKQNELELKPGEKSQKPLKTRKELVEAHDAHVAAAREALQNTTDEHLMKLWQLKVGGKVVHEEPRYVVLTDSVFSHLAHHRGQLTVYLRLNEAKVPSIYGPSADDRTF